MPSIEKISIALPQEMLAVLRQAVEEVEYAIQQRSGSGRAPRLDP